MNVPADRDAALRAGRAPAAEDVALLRRRAALLARAVAQPQARARLQVVLFVLAGERYALDATLILRVLTLRELTPLPGAAPPLFGVTQWRGSVLTLLDLRPVLGATAPGLSDMRRVIVLEGAGREFGIVVDEVSNMDELDTDAVMPISERGEGQDESLVGGITQDGIFVIDGARLLSRYGSKASPAKGAGMRRVR
jgi:purine-binding chemotaxis protein CheW